MKNIKLKSIFVLCSLFFVLLSFGQAPQSLNYQAVARDVNGVLDSVTLTKVRFSIRNNNTTGAPVYQEDHTGVPTNRYGLFTLQIGNGTPQIGTFSNIDWTNGTKYVEVEINTGGGLNSIGNTQLISVPYALYSNKTFKADSAGYATHALLADSATNASHASSANSATNATHATVADSAINTYWGKTGNQIYNSNSGNVSIGGASPADTSFALQVHKDANTAFKAWGNTSNYVGMYIANTITNGSDWLLMSSGGAVIPRGSFGIADNSRGQVRMVIDTTGQVGIGTANPAYPLHVTGTATHGIEYIRTGSKDARITVGDTSKSWSIAVGWATAGDFSVLEEGATHRFYIQKGTGNVGIGTTNPSQNLSVQKSISLDEGSINDGSLTAGALIFGPISCGEGITSKRSGSGNLNGLNFITGFANRMTITNTGNVGINTTSPTQAKLVVSGSQSYNAGNYGYLNSGGSTGIGNANYPYSIYASDHIAASEFNAYSDARIKKVIGVSNSENDLSTVSKIKITDYKFIDAISKGNGTYKKVIAQELKQVYPTAVSLITDVVPDIYQIAEIKNGQVNIKNNLQKGDKVKLIFAKGEELLDVKSADKNGFAVDTKEEGKVFVYGKQVNDFHVVDYEALTTLNISATQELLKMINRMQDENAQLSKALSSATNDIEMIKTHLNMDKRSEK